MKDDTITHAIAGLICVIGVAFAVYTYAAASGCDGTIVRGVIMWE